MHSPSELTAFLSCKHLSDRDRAAKAKLITKPHFHDPLKEVLSRQGIEHEKGYLEKLKKEGKKMTIIPDGEEGDKYKKTEDAIIKGFDVIYQGALASGEWHGYADFLVKTNTSSKLGDYSYKVVDTKLSSEAKGSALLQLCVYSDLLSDLQGKPSDEIIIALGSGEEKRFTPESFTAYYRYIRNKFIEFARNEPIKECKIQPIPVEHCQICDWRGECEDYWHKNDTLNLVAGLGKNQRKILEENGTTTLKEFAEIKELPEVKYSQIDSLERAQKQAKIQFKGRKEKANLVEFILPVQDNQGLCGLPEPNDGDIWFDIEGDPHIRREGLEYLFGWVVLEKGKAEYHHVWAKNAKEEKHAFETFMEFVLERLKKWPDLYIYHFGHYEATVVRNLSTRYHCYADETDDLLRKEKWVDLNRVVKSGLRLSTDGYGLKDIECFYGFERKTNLILAGRSRKAITLALDFEKPIESTFIDTCQNYNEEDCLSTRELHVWLEERRKELETSGTKLSRRFIPEFEEREDGKIDELSTLAEKLFKKLPEDKDSWNEFDIATQTLADLLLWYRREGKSYWWEYFRMRDLVAVEAMDENRVIGGLWYDKIVGTEKNSTIYRFRFPPQTLEDRKQSWHSCGTESINFGKAYDLNPKEGFIDFKWSAKKAAGEFEKARNTDAIFSSDNVAAENQIDRLKDFGQWILINGLENNPAKDDLKYSSARNMLLKMQILGKEGDPLRKPGEETLATSRRLALELNQGTVLPIQGPPGSGKTFTGAHMIMELLKAGKKVGITAQSHAVILNLLKAAVKVAVSEGLSPKVIKQLKKENIDKEKEELGELLDLVSFRDSKKIAESSDGELIGGTSWLWSRPDMAEKVDVLFIDEGGQFSLADTLAVSHSAAAMVLLGDPQQLENVSTGVHPPDVEVSALGHWLKEGDLIADDKGLFLDKTYRMHPYITKFISEVFYNGKLESSSGLKNQEIIFKGEYLSGSGLRYFPVNHTGNKSSSEEEALRIREVIKELLDNGKWQDKLGKTHLLTMQDIVIVAPYNAQVEVIRQHIPEARVGTVDKFQGQEAPIVIYSMTTSTQEEAPRGMEFLYSLNRLNVAVSRAQCLSILVASPELLELECKTPRQMELANAFCRFLELQNECR